MTGLYKSFRSVPSSHLPIHKIMHYIIMHYIIGTQPKFVIPLHVGFIQHVAQLVVLLNWLKGDDER